MVLEVNETTHDETASIGGGIGMLTPGVREDYWLFRVRVGSGNQAVVGFPKFGTIGIGFAQEQDWNTNLPCSCTVEAIWEHIEHNRGDDMSITDTACLEAIRMVREAAISFLTAKLGVKEMTGRLERNGSLPTTPKDAQIG